jgi:hypothetical protein
VQGRRGERTRRRKEKRSREPEVRTGIKQERARAFARKAISQEEGCKKRE